MIVTTAGRDHWGLVLVNDGHLPPSGIGGGIGALAALLKAHVEPGGLKNVIVFLRRAGN